MPVSLRAGVVVVGDTRLSVPRPCVASITTPAVTATASRPDTKVTIMAVCFEARKRDLRSSSTEYVLPFARLNTISRGLRVEEASSAVTPVAVSGSSRTSVRLPAVRGGAAIGIAVLGVLRDPVAGGRGRLEFFAGGGEHVLVDLGGHGGDDITGRRSDHRTADADLRCEQERGDGGKGARHDG